MATGFDILKECDDSIFSNIKLEDFINDESQQNALGIGLFDVTCTSDFKNNDSSDHLFSEIITPTQSSWSCESRPLTDECNARKKLRLEEPCADRFDLDEDTSDAPIPSLDMPDVQCTQMFLNDVAANVAKHLNSTIRPGDLPFTQHAGIDSMSQYEAFQTPETHDVQQYNWDTQAFTQVSLYPNKGSFFGLPHKVKQIIFSHKGIKDLYDWQHECLNLPAISQRKNLIYALPTSGGKTLVAEIIMLRELICRQKNVLFILPYVAIVQEKVSAMAPFAVNLDFIVEEYTAGKGKCPPVQRRKRSSLFIASIEKGAVLFDSLIEAERANEIGLVVVDELHLIGERGRGATLETLLTKIMFLNANIQIVGMSATIGNLSEISAFLKADLYTRSFRPVELKEYLKCGKDILTIEPDGQTVEDVFAVARTIDYNYSAAVARADPDHLAGLVAECAPHNSCLIFCPSRKNCENVALLLKRILPSEKFLSHKKKDKQDLMDALDKVCGVLSPVLAKTIPYGVAYHHSGLTTDERKYIELAYRYGTITVICCTSTLAAGVNLPAKRVIIRAPYVGSDFLTLSRYKQMVGRAGRAGLGEVGESIMICSSRDNARVGEMLFSPMDRVVSYLAHNDSIGLVNLILSAVGLGLVTCRREIKSLISQTLLFQQKDSFEGSLDALILSILRDMFKNKVLRLCGNSENKNGSNTLIITQDLQRSPESSSNRRLMIGTSTKFQLTEIGKAAFKAGIDYKRAFAMRSDLKSALKHLILTNYGHLLYLVVSFNSNEKGDELFAANAGVLFNLYNRMDPETQLLFRLLGVTEAQAARIAKTSSVQGPLEIKLNRLYKTLILIDVINVEPMPVIASKYSIERGTLQSLLNQTIGGASALVRLCEHIESFWCFKPLFEQIVAKLDRCATVELQPLLELPAVKINRAKQFYAAGFRTIEDIAKARPTDLASSVEHLPFKVAREIISAAKMILMNKLVYLEEQTEALKSCLVESGGSLTQ